MSATPTPSTRSTGEGATGSAQLTKLTAYDGLFLRAEHLTALQTYAEQVAAAVGRAGGSGVVHGLAVRLDNGRLVVDPGLAIDAAGHSLVVDQGVEIPLENLQHTQTTRVGLGEICLLELVAKETPTGDGGGQMYVDPYAAGAATSRPYATRAATPRLAAPRQVDIGAAIPSSQFRSRVATAWFATEQATVSLVPNNGPAVGAFSAPEWRTGPPPPAIARDAAVPLALLLKVDSSAEWQVDMWVARRDRLDTPPMDMWHYRLGGRPRAVFLAQVLQFQAQLSTLTLSEPGPPPPNELVAFLEDALSAVRQSQGKQRIEQALNMAREQTASPSGGSLLAAGIVDLPPAGYLPVDTAKPVLGQVATILGPRVTPRLCVCAPDDVLGVISDSQHRGRIPLDGDACSDVDVVVPNGQGTGGEAAVTAPLGWVAFARRSGVECASTTVAPPERRAPGRGSDAPSTEKPLPQHREGDGPSAHGGEGPKA
jgi:hypothetical protein